MRKAVFFVILILSGVAVIYLTSPVSVLSTSAAERDKQPDEAYFKNMDAKKKKIWATIKDDSDFERMGRPSPGEWLASFRERGENFEEYKKSCYNRKTKERNKIYIIPLGTKSKTFEKIINAMKDYGKAFFGCETVLLAYQPMPKSAYNKRRRQYHAGVILEMLKKKIPDDAVCFVAFTEDDLYVPRLNFVFGLGSLGARVGTFSMNRYGSDYRKKLKRALKVMNHEIGHIFSMEHCIYYNCTMNGSNSLTESDSRPPHLCPVCLKKLAYANGLDVAERYKALAEFYLKHKFRGESLWCLRRHYKTGKFDAEACVKAFEERVDEVLTALECRKKLCPAEGLYGLYWRLLGGDGTEKMQMKTMKRLIEANIKLLDDTGVAFDGSKYETGSECVSYRARRLLERLTKQKFGDFTVSRRGPVKKLTALNPLKTWEKDKGLAEKWRKWWSGAKDTFK